MKDIGIPEEKTKPVLKHLLRVYEKNWELIEQENYRVLADAIFDSAESEVAEQKKKLDDAEAAEKKKVEQAERMKAIEDETQIQEEPEKPLLRLRVRHRDDQASPSCISPNINSGGNLLKKPKLKINDLPESQPELQSPAEITESMFVLITDPQPLFPPKEDMNNEKQADLPIILVKPKDEPLTDDPIRVEVPLALIMPESSTNGDASTENNLVKELDPTKTMNLSNCVQGTSNETHGSELFTNGDTLTENNLVKEPDPTKTMILSHCVQETSNETNGSESLTSGGTSTENNLVKEPDPTNTKNLSTRVQETPNETNGSESMTNGDASTENNLIKEQEPDPTKTMNLSNRAQETSNETTGSTAKIDIASSSSGEIKISLTCKSDEGNPKFSFKNADSVLKTMEDKCLKSYKFLDTNFSLKKLMKDVCDCFLDLGPDCSGEPPVNTDAILPTENGFEENNNFMSDENVDTSKVKETVVNTDAISPTNSLKTENDFEKETENGFEDNDHFIQDETVDIAKGEESVVISLVNEVNSESLPSFHYIPRNAIFQNAYVNFSLVNITKENCCTTCFGNCVTSSTPCPCALQNSGEFAYTNEGTIKEDLLDDCIQTNRDPKKCHLSYCKECPLEKPKNEAVLGACKGHLERGFIKECWLKCGCNKKCGNRVVQCGIRYKLQVFMTPGRKGWGLRALEDLPKGAFVCEFVGEVLTCKELYNRVSQSCKKDEYAYTVFLDAEWSEESELQEDEALCLDATCYGNVARFINHRCFDANLIEIPVEVENSDRHYYHLAFFTTRKVKPFEELTRDYGLNFDDNDDPVKAAFECQCGSPFCRNRKGSRGSRKRKCAQN